MAQVALPQAHVRFHPDCVLIPESPARPIKPHMESRTLSLPLSWSRKPNEADMDDPTFTPTRPTKLVVKIPSFTRRPKVHSPEREHPLRGCLHSPSSPPRHIPIFLPPVVETAPQPMSASPPNSSLPSMSPTIPLRPCCQACYNKMLLALEDNYVPKWSPGARRKKERDEKEALACSPSDAHCSLDILLDESFTPFVFGHARVDEVEVHRGKGATTKIDEEATDEDGSDLSSPLHDLPNPFEKPRPPPVMSPSAEDRAFADMLPSAISPVSRTPAPTPISPPSSYSPGGHDRRQSFSGRSSSMLQACLRGGSAVLKSVTSGEGNVNIKLL